MVLFVLMALTGFTEYDEEYDKCVDASYLEDWMAMPPYCRELTLSFLVESHHALEEKCSKSPSSGKSFARHLKVAINKRMRSTPECHVDDEAGF